VAGDRLQAMRPHMQMVFQDPFSALDPRMTVYDIISEPLQANPQTISGEAAARVRELMTVVGLDARYMRRYPHAFSTGQRQRISVARALATNPEFIVCDEPVSALDVLVQDQVLTLLRDLQREYGLSYLFISHDLAVVRLISDYVCVMKDGRLVEAASSEEIFTNPRDPYTRRLLASIPGNELGIAG
jgi:peptide/nickel transport system ATP-binding protein